MGIEEKRFTSRTTEIDMWGAVIYRSQKRKYSLQCLTWEIGVVLSVISFLM